MSSLCLKSQFCKIRSERIYCKIGSKQIYFMWQKLKVKVANILSKSQKRYNKYVRDKIQSFRMQIQWQNLPRKKQRLKY